MSEQVALVPTEIRTVAFYGDEITGALVQIGGDPQVYIPVRPLCDFMGLNWSGQRQRILRDDVLAESLKVCALRTHPGGVQDMLCLPLKFLPGWLFGLSTDRLKPELREKITRYRRECYDALWNVFKYDIVQMPLPVPAPQPSGAALAYELATAVQNLAREQMEIEARQTQQEGRLNAAAAWAKGIDARVTALEVRVLPDTQITNSQAGELALTVKNVAGALEQRGQVNSYQRVYAELYRRFSISSYKSLAASRFQEALKWLRDWYDELGGA